MISFILYLLAAVMGSLARFVVRVRILHGVFKIGPEDDQVAFRLVLCDMPRKDRTFTCNDIIRFVNNNLDPGETDCVVGQLLGRRLQEITPITEATIARWRRAVANVRALARFVPPPLRGMINLILDIMDLILGILDAAF